MLPELPILMLPDFLTGTLSPLSSTVNWQRWLTCILAGSAIYTLFWIERS